MAALIPKPSITRFLGRTTPRHVSYPAAAAAGSLLAVCSCTIVPLFAGIYRKGAGLGPAITPQALEGKPLLSMASTIYGGRPGTPMPGWSAMLTLEEAHWVAQQLAEGFPEESRRPAR